MLEIKDLNKSYGSKQVLKSDEIVSKSKNIKIKLENINNFISISLVPH